MKRILPEECGSQSPLNRNAQRARLTCCNVGRPGSSAHDMAAAPSSDSAPTGATTADPEPEVLGNRRGTSHRAAAIATIRSELVPRRDLCELEQDCNGHDQEPRDDSYRNRHSCSGERA